MGYIKQITIPENGTNVTYDIAPTQMNPTAAAGDELNPIYINSTGIPTQVTVPESGAWFNGVPQVVSGAIKIGKYIDFHNTDDSTNNYDVRLESSSTGLSLNTAGQAFRLRNINYGTATPTASDGSDGDVYIQYT